MVVSLMSSSSPRSLGLHGDRAGLRLGGLRERDGEHAVLHRRRALLRIDLHRQREALRELERRALLPVHEPALRHVLLALAAQREDVLVDGELDVLLAQPRQIGLEHEGLPGVVEREPREAAAPEALGVAYAGASGLELLPDAIHAA